MICWLGLRKDSLDEQKLLHIEFSMSEKRVLLTGDSS